MVSSDPCGFFAAFPDTGLCVWGQRTPQSQPCALDRANVRRQMKDMEETKTSAA